MDPTQPGAWRKSSYSAGNNGACVEVAPIVGGTAVRDSKLGDHSPILRFAAGTWAAFLDSTRRPTSR